MSEEKVDKSPKGYKKAYQKAEKIAADKTAFQKLLESSLNKSVQYQKRLKEIWEELQIFLRMLKAWKDGDHHFEWKTILSITAAVLYFVNPFDIIPDLIPALGLVDDIGIITYVFKRLEEEIESFSNWEQSQNQPQEGNG